MAARYSSVARRLSRIFWMALLWVKSSSGSVRKNVSPSSGSFTATTLTAQAAPSRV